MLISLYVLLYCIGAGLLCFFGMKYKLRKPENKEKFDNEIFELSKDLKIAEEDCLNIVWSVLLFLGFIFLPIALFRKIIKFAKGEE